MLITIPAFDNGTPIPEQYAYCKYDAVKHKTFGGNKNPKIIWSDLPEGTKSLVLICVDDKVPSIFNDANKEGKFIPKDMPRINFYHWVLIDINPALGEIKEGAASDGITAGGKPAGKRRYGVAGVNSYGETHGGYDGPCPPWNDRLVHEYHFKLYALDVPSLNLKELFTGPDVMEAMKAHILGEGSWMGTYTLNPSLRKNLSATVLGG